jgi:hypothetical protein
VIGPENISIGRFGIGNLAASRGTAKDPNPSQIANQHLSGVVV